MSWADIDLTSIPTDIDVLPEGREYVFELLGGAKYSQFNPNRVEAAAKVADGEFSGRVVYFSYPDPAEQAWSPGVFVRLTKAIGTDIDTDEKPVEYLNRVAGGRFVSKVKHRIASVGGDDITKADLSIFNVKAVK